MAGYNFTTCSPELVCAPMKTGKLVGSGIGFCNLTAPDQGVSTACTPQTTASFSADKFSRLQNIILCCVRTSCASHAAEGRRGELYQRLRKRLRWVQYEVQIDGRPQFMLAGQQPIMTPAAVTKTVNDGGASASSTVGAVNGLQDVLVTARKTTSGATCKLPVVYKCGACPP